MKMEDSSRRRIYVAGHAGMLGSAIVRNLSKDPNVELVTKSSQELDLRRQLQVEKFFETNTIDEVYIAAAKVGGIYANSTKPAEFCHDNLMIASNLIGSAHSASIKKVLFIGSSCIYPKLAKQPISETELLNGHLEPTNEPYAIAKIAGLKLIESYNRQYAAENLDYRAVMPTNLYGLGDNYDSKNSHVIPALLRRFHEAKERGVESVEIWGSGRVRREFLTSDDAAAGCIHIMNLPKSQYDLITTDMCRHINIGSGEDIEILELASKIATIVGFTGQIVFDKTKPEGTPRKLLDNTKIFSTGWRPSISLEDGLKKTYRDYLINFTKLRK